VAMLDDSLSITIRPRQVLQALLLIIAVLILANIAVLGAFLGGWIQSTEKKTFTLFYVLEEGNLPTWFSTLLLAACSTGLGLVARGKSVQGDRYAKHWWVLCAIFALMSLDETARIHESVNRYMRGLVDLGGFFFYPWVLLGVLFAAIFIIAYTRFLLALDRRTRLRFIIAGIVYLVGVLGMESIGGWVDETRGTENWAYFAEATLEELFEMFGAALFLTAVLIHLRSMIGSVWIKLGEDS
jgi:hypothetical protein